MRWKLAIQITLFALSRQIRTIGSYCEHVGLDLAHVYCELASRYSLLQKRRGVLKLYDGIKQQHADVIVVEAEDRIGEGELFRFVDSVRPLSVAFAYDHDLPERIREAATPCTLVGPPAWRRRQRKAIGLGVSSRNSAFC
jgi:hypothetical protein